MKAPPPRQRALPTLDALSSLETDGSRRYVFPADVRGRWVRLRRVVFAVLIAALLGLPWLKVHGNPALLLDIPRRTFFVLGQPFSSADAWLLFFVLSAGGFGLIVATAMLGRVWCGFACPQTVFVEGVFRVVERWIEGSGEQRLRLSRMPWSAEKVLKRSAKYAAYLALSLLIAGSALGYFVPVRSLARALLEGPSAHAELYAWGAGLAALALFDLGWFREQFCIIMCPYGRLQSALTDRDTLVVGYDARRGEPRGKRSLELVPGAAGDCIDCRRCVAVCPTGIDIRQGLQLECVGCMACIDACDEVMAKVERPAGLIRFDSTRGFGGEPTRFLRPRTAVYALLAVAGLTAAALALRSRGDFEATVLRPRAEPFSVSSGEVRNVLRVRLVNKERADESFRVEPLASEGISFVVSQPEVQIPSLGSVEVAIIATVPEPRFHGDVPLRLRVTSVGTRREKLLTATFLGPGR